MSEYPPPREIIPIFNPLLFNNIENNFTVRDGDLRYLKLIGGVLNGSLVVKSDLIVNTNTLYVNSTINRVGINKQPTIYALDIAGSLNLNVGHAYNMNATSLLNSSTLGSGVVNSSLTSLGVLTSLNVVGVSNLATTCQIYNNTGHPSLNLYGSSSQFGTISFRDDTNSTRSTIFVSTLSNALNLDFQNLSSGLNVSSSGVVRFNIDAGGNLDIASNRTVFKTLGQQIRIGYPSILSSIPSPYTQIGFHYKTLPIVQVTSSTFDIAFTGAQGLYTPSGVDICSGFLIIHLKNITNDRVGTTIYTICKRTGQTLFAGSSILSNVLLGWTTNPTYSNATGNALRITFNAADWSGTYVSWSFFGCV